MLGRFLWRQRPFTCTDVDARVDRVRDGRLSAGETAAFKAHVAECNACRQRLKTETAWLTGLQTTPAPARLTPTERRAMQQALGRQMRRGMLMRNIRLSVQQVAVVAVLALVVGAMVWWQTAVAPVHPDDGEGLDTAVISPTATSRSITDMAQETITIQFAVNDLEWSQYERLIPLFEEKNPNIRIRLVSLESMLAADGEQSSEDEVQRLATTADVFPSFISPAATQAGLVRDLTPFIEADADFRPEDYPTGILDQFRWQGGLWAVPLDADVELIYFNKAHFDEMGVPYPAPGWAWNDFTAAAVALTQKQGDEVIRWGYLSSPVDSVPFIVAQAGPLADASSGQLLPRFTAPEVVAATEAYTSFIRELAQPENAERLMEPLSTGGRVSMWPGSLDQWNTFTSLATMGVAPFPTGTGSAQTSLISIQGLSMSGGTQHPEAAWRWMSFLSRQYLNTPSSPMPLRQSVATAVSYWDSLEPELALSLQTALNQVYRGNREVPLRHFLGAIDMALTGEYTVAEALTNAQSYTVAEINGLHVTGDATPIPTVIVSVPEKITPDENGVVITFSRLDRLFGTASFDLLRDQFQQDNPNIHIEFVPVRLSGLVTIPQLAAEADCFQWIPRLQDANARASVLSLEPFIAADSSLNIDDFFPATLTPFTVQGQLWGLPANSRPYVIEYNKALFDAAGIVYPSQQWTVDDFLDIAVALTQGEGSRKVYGFVPDRSESESLLALSEQLGAVWVDNTVDPPRTGFSQPATVEAIRWYMQLSTEYGVKPVFDATQTEDRDSLIREGRAGMWITLSPGEYEMPNVGIAPLPFPVESTAAPGATQLSGYFISSAAAPEARQACWQWLTFLTEQPNATWGIPARHSVAESAAYRQNVGAELADAYLASIGSGEQLAARSFAVQADWIRWTQWWLIDAYDQVIAGEHDLESALAAAQSLADTYRNCIIDNNATASETGQSTCIWELDETLYNRFWGGQ